MTCLDTFQALLPCGLGRKLFIEQHLFLASKLKDCSLPLATLMAPAFAALPVRKGRRQQSEFEVLSFDRHTSF